MDDTTELDDVPEVEDELDTVETEGDDDTLEGEADEPEEETFELEKDGKQFRIPAALKDEIMLRADYTRKTQEVAEQRKALETQITEASKASDEEVNTRAALVAVDAALAQYQNVDWNALEKQDPQGAQSHFRSYMQLQQHQGQLKDDLTGAVQRRETETQRATAEQIQLRIAEVQRDIPDWGQAKAETLMAFGEKQLGLSREFMVKVDGSSDRDPALVKLINALYVASQSKADKPRAVSSELKPVLKVKGGSAPRKVLDDRMSADDWVKQRNAQLAKR